MGQRANLLIVGGGSYDLYYTHHRANTLDHDLFWGPDYALGFIRAQRRVDDSGWLDDVWAEGGAVLDVDRRTLLWFGGEDVMYDVPLRRAHSDLMAQVWAGWTVRWAHGGIADMAAAVGYPMAAVLSERKEPPAKRPPAAAVLEPGDDPEWSNTIATARLASAEVRVSRLPGNCPDILYAGDAIATAVRDAGWPATLDLDWTADEYQSGGFHVDLPDHKVDLWTASPMRAADVQRRVQDCWPGWSVTWHGDEFESQLGRAAGHLRLRLPDRGRLLEHCGRSLLRPEDHRESGAEAIVSAARLIDGQTDMTVTGINPAALFDARLSVPLDVRTRLFDAAVAAAPH